MKLTLRGLQYAVWQEQSRGWPVLALHGFTGAGRTWREIALPPDMRLIAPDLPGHGATEAPANPTRYSLVNTVADLIALLDALRIERCIVLGYSMGGRIALGLAAHAPTRVEALVLESASPGIVDPDERAVRRAADHALADRIEQQGIAAFVQEWESLPLFASQQALPAHVQARLHAQRLANKAAGLAGSLRGIGQGVQPSLWDALPTLHMPISLIAGALDTRYCALARAMMEALPQAQLTIVPNAGHAIHLEQPDHIRNAVDRAHSHLTEREQISHATHLATPQAV